MIDLPDTVPVFRTSDGQEAYRCSIQAARYYNVSPYIVQTILQIEGGVKGSKVLNTNKTHDHGIMQINTIWLNELKRMENIDIDANRLINDVCYNIHIGTWILSYRISEVNGDIWRGLGNYHSKTKKYHDIYLARAKRAYSQIISHWSNSLGVGNPSSVEDIVHKSINTTTVTKRASRSAGSNIQYSISP